jgi:hypothetical protein
VVKINFLILVLENVFDMEESVLIKIGIVEPARAEFSLSSV